MTDLPERYTLTADPGDSLNPRFKAVPNPRAPVVMSNALSAGQIAELLDLVAKHRDDEESNVSTPPAIRVLAGDPVWMTVLGAHATLVAEHYGRVVTGLVPHISIYGPGDGLGPHIDASGAGELHKHRTVSLSIAINDPSEFTGGELELWWNGQMTSAVLPQGTLVGFTAHTPHLVQPVRSGERIVIVAFGYDLRDIKT